MFDKWLKLPAHLYLRITALLIITVGVSLSNVLMSIGSIWIISNWILEGDFAKKWERFKSEKVLWPIVFIFFYSILSIAWSDNVDYWFQDVRVKLPFIVIPFVMGTSEPLQPKFFRFLLYVFIGMVTYTSLYNFIGFHIETNGMGDIREMSRFISHVRFSIVVVLAIFSCCYLILKRIGNPVLWLLPIPWFIYYTYRAEVINGYLLFGLLLLVSLIYVIRSLDSSRLKWMLSLGFSGILLAGIVLTYNSVSKFQGFEEVDISKLPMETVNGNPYYHDTTIKQMEGGKYIWINVNQEELEKAWNRRSDIDYHGKDEQGQPMFGTILRYLTSKDLTKDSLGVWSLSDKEIREIESGKTNAHWISGLDRRVHSFLLEYEIYLNGGDPNGHSILQRIEHLQAAKCVIKQNWLLGVGSGDVPVAFDKCYDKTGSLLVEHNRHHSHNQFLTFWISHGLLGLIAFILIFVLAVKNKKRLDYFSIIVLISLFVSCLFQDMLETQAGVTIFGFFLALSLYRSPLHSS